MALDKTDLNIIVILARNFRTSYNKIGLLAGLKPKTVNARVRGMVCGGAIERLAVRVNRATFSYKNN